jgi:zinc/manganese transport system ATP-binding protein
MTMNSGNARHEDVGAPITKPSAVEFDQATARLGERTLWRDVTLTVAQGEFVALLGPNGVGKTVLLKVILGLVPLTAGEVRVLGLDPRAARSQVGYLPQGRGFDQSVRVRGTDIVSLGLEGPRWGVPLPGRRLFRPHDQGPAERVKEVIELVGASGYADRPIGSLSGGEQQRLLIAQAIVHRPALLLLDEPLASLDYSKRTAITDLVGRISREQAMTVIMVTHDVNPIIGRAGKLIYIARQGVAAGTPEHVVNSETLTRIYGSRVEVHVTSEGRLLVVAEPGAGPGQVIHSSLLGGPDDGGHARCDSEASSACDLVE